MKKADLSQANRAVLFGLKFADNIHTCQASIESQAPELKTYQRKIKRKMAIQGQRVLESVEKAIRD